MGRATFAQVQTFEPWPYEGTPLTVLSRSLTAVPEHLIDKAELSSLEPRTVLEHLARRGCRRVYVDGGKVIQSFLREDLIDELDLTTLPILIGQGIPLFGPLSGDVTWELLEARSLADGLVRSRYQRRR